MTTRWTAGAFGAWFLAHAFAVPMEAAPLEWQLQHSDPSSMADRMIMRRSIAPLPHVRPLDALAIALIEAGKPHSTTFAELLAALDQAPDTATYVSMTARIDGRGSIVFVARASGITYLLIRVSTKQSKLDRVAILAHELTHAVEVAHANPPVASDADLRRLFACIGVDAAGRTLESVAAIRAERAVRQEYGR